MTLLLLAGAGAWWLLLYALISPVVFRLAILAADDYGLFMLPTLLRLRAAMRERQIVVYYQPKISLRTNAVTGVEALARWLHPERGLLLPAQWLPPSDIKWLERQFGEYVLDAAISQAREWERAGTPVVVSVNVSPWLFVEEQLPRRIAAALERHGLPPSLLVVELTEAALALSGSGETVARELAEIGVGLAIDDFGIGHSSMERLLRLPVRELKIDRRFVAGLRSGSRECAILRAALSLREDIGLSVVAEGVEAPETLELLRAAGCDAAQGFLLARPCPPDAVTDRLRTPLRLIASA